MGTLQKNITSRASTDEDIEYLGKVFTGNQNSFIRFLTTCIRHEQAVPFQESTYVCH